MTRRYHPIAHATNALPAISSADPMRQKSAQYKAKQWYAKLRYSVVLPQSDKTRLRTVFRPAILQANSGCSRSEEHTSELQSRENLVCRLLLEKKKKQKKI